MKKIKLVFLVCMISLGLSSTLMEYDLIKKSDTENSIIITNSVNSSVNEDGFTKLDISKGSTVDVGFPELPTYTTFYQLDIDREYEIELIVHDSYLIDNIKVYPHQGPEDGAQFTLNEEFYSSEEIYPYQNISFSNRMYSRGIDVVSIEVIPFNYYPDSEILEVFTNFEIFINEIGVKQDSNSFKKRSKLFDSLLNEFIVNFESSSREEDYQTPSILYICGGNTENNSYFQDLVEWRHQQGYVVNTASLSETGSSASSIKNYIQNAYNTWENPPEYVALVGDVGGSYSLPTFYDGFGHNSYGNDCEGDLPYSQLDGDDFLPEVIVGRISVRSSTELAVVVAKTLAYEKATYIEQTGTGWYESAALVGDPSSSGQSTIHVNQYIDNLLDNHGFSNIETAYSGNYDGFMEDQLEDGVLYINYRGYLGVSGFDGNDINGANSGYMTPFSTILTCGTGSYAEDNTCLSEAMLRYGSVSNPKGAVAAVSTATWNTHTLFNNIVAMGMYDGIFSKDLPTTGLALASGKLTLLDTYPSAAASSWVGAFTQWNNLMGDPAILLWTDTPSSFNIEHENSISVGSNILDIIVKDEYNQPLEGAWVSILKGNDEIFLSSISNQMGKVTFNWDGDVDAGEIVLTITKRNYIPYQQTITIVDTGDHLSISNLQIDDDFGGNGDGLLNPGEFVGLHLSLTNHSDNFLTDISAHIESDNENIFIDTSSPVSFNSVAGDETTDTTEPIYFTLNTTAIDHENLDVRLLLSVGETDHLVFVPLNVVGGNISIVNYDTDDHVVTIGETNELNLTIRNDGSIAMQDIAVELLPYENLVTVPSSIAYVFQISSGGQESVGPFTINVSDQAIAGTIIPMEFIFSNPEGFNQSQTHNIQLGMVGHHDPLGPDEYGYYIYDSGDAQYEIAPEYDWIELDDGLGTVISLDDDGNANGSNPTEVLTLPFNFRFYGIDYNQITVAVDGYLSFGSHEVQSHRNYPIPGAGGPSPMVAAFWDDLKTGSSGNVYKYTSDEMVIIQWDYLRTHENGSRETFQIILYNSEYQDFETTTGDGEIKIQYYDFNNTSDGNFNSYPPDHGCYSTIGIKNHLGDTGLQYSFNNIYPSAASPLSDGDALLITTGRLNDYLLGDVNADESINILDVVILVTIILNEVDPTGYQMEVSDMNLDGSVNILDVVMLVNIILGD